MTHQTISETVHVEAPPAVVFAILTDPRQHARIDGSGSVGSVIEAPERLTAKGDTFSVDMKMFGLPYKITNHVVELEDDRLIAWRHFGGHRWRYELAPVADGSTEVTETFDYSRYNSFWATVLKVTGFPERNRRGIAGTLQRLKQAAEADAADRSA
jgi:uncharacterized protein YndB with AHSA1/START domain